MDRLVHYHSLRFAMRDRLFYAPIEHPTSVIDVGTGTGIWALDMADAWPGAQVLGIDLSPTQPTWVAPNLEFQLFDLEETWDMPLRFDFVHCREMNGFSIKDWPKYFEQAFLSLKPGGWIECQEFDLKISSDDNTIPEESWVLQWQSLWEEGVQKAGMTGRCYPDKMADQMREAGFINVNILPFKMPIGPWAKDPMLRQSGLCTLIGLLEGVTGLSVRVFTQLLGWSVEEMEILLAKVRNEWKNKKVHSYFPM
jgi:SAM-dependent methyltransferase